MPEAAQAAAAGRGCARGGGGSIAANRGVGEGSVECPVRWCDRECQKIEGGLSATAFNDSAATLPASMLPPLPLCSSPPRHFTGRRSDGNFSKSHAAQAATKARRWAHTSHGNATLAAAEAPSAAEQQGPSAVGGPSSSCFSTCRPCTRGPWWGGPPACSGCMDRGAWLACRRGATVSAA